MITVNVVKYRRVLRCTISVAVPEYCVTNDENKAGKALEFDTDSRHSQFIIFTTGFLPN